MTPTDDQIAKAKAAASEAGKSAMLLPFDDFDLEVLVRELTSVEFAEYIDVSSAGLSAGAEYVLAKCLLWPTIEQAAGIMPAVGEEIAGVILERAGVINKKPLLDVATLAVLTTAGVPESEAAPILAANPGKGRVVLFRLPSLNITAVLRRPSAEAFHAFRDGQAAAKREDVGRFAVYLHAARDLVAWSSEPLDSIVARAPGVIIDLQREFSRMGGAGAKRGLKSI